MNLTAVRFAIASLKRNGLSIDSFSISPEAMVDLEAQSIAVDHVIRGPADSDLASAFANHSRTLYGIPLNKVRA